VVKQLDPRDRVTFGKIPINETPDLVSCPTCIRPIIRHAVKQHMETCGKEKPAAKSSTKADKVSGKSIPNREIAVMPSKTKKRKLDDSMVLDGR
jgi:hypothetical protein